MDGMTIWETMIESNVTYLTKVPAALFTLAVAYIVIRAARRIIVTATSLARVDRTVQSMILSVVSFAGWILALAAALNVIGLSQLSLAVGGSVALIAMALATGLNSVTQDLMAGMFLIGDDEFAVGKRVKAGGIEGVLEGLTIRKTKIRDDNGQVHTIPNRSVDSGTYVIIGPKDAKPDEKVG